MLLNDSVALGAVALVSLPPPAPRAVTVTVKLSTRVQCRFVATPQKAHGLELVANWRLRLRLRLRLTLTPHEWHSRCATQTKTSFTAVKASYKTTSLQVDAHALTLRPQPRFYFGFGELQRHFFGSEFVWVQEQRAVLWRRHQPQRQHQRQRGAQGENERKQLGRENVPGQSVTKVQ